jgi:hypothetical protein
MEKSIMQMRNSLLESQIRKVTWRPLSSSPHLRELIQPAAEKSHELEGQTCSYLLSCMNLGKLP